MLWLERQRPNQTVTDVIEPPYLHWLVRKVIDLDNGKSAQTVVKSEPPATFSWASPDPHMRCADLPPIILQYLIRWGAGQLLVGGAVVNGYTFGRRQTKSCWVVSTRC